MTTRSLVLGVGMVALLVWVTLFASAGAVQVATLAAAVGGVIWFATVSPERLVAHDGRLDWLLFGLTALGGAVLLTGALILATGTLYLIAAIGLAGGVVGLVRAIRHTMRMPPGGA